MMTKDGSTAPSLQSVSPQGAVLVTLPTSATATTLTTSILQGAIIKEEADEDLAANLVASLAVPGHGVTTISNVRATHATLQSLLAAPVSAARMVPSQEQTIQVITLPSTSELITTSQPDGGGRVWQVVPSLGNGEMATIIAVADPSELIQATKADIGEGIDLDIQEATELPVTNADAMAAILMPPPPPADCPAWASRMHSCEKIGESYRGYVESEAELDLLLTYHKQHTSSFWGTRQSPSPAKPSTRLMWKSQYVPFDGIPFVNIAAVSMAGGINCGAPSSSPSSYSSSPSSSPSSPGLSSCGSAGHKCPLIQAFFNCTAPLRVRVQEMNRRLAVLCSFHPSGVLWVVRVLHLVILSPFLMIAIHSATVASCWMFMPIFFKSCWVLSDLGRPRLPTVADDHPEEVGSRCSRRKTCTELVHKSVQTFSVEPEVQRTCTELVHKSVQAFPLEPEVQRTCKGHEQETECNDGSADKLQLNNSGSQPVASQQWGEHERAVHPATIHTTQEALVEESRPVQQPHHHQTPSTERPQDAFSRMVEMPGEDAGVAKQKLPTDPDTRRIPLHRPGSLDSQDTTWVASPQKTPRKVHRTEKKIGPSFVKESLQITQLMLQKPELNEEDLQKKLAAVVDEPEAGWTEGAKSILKRDLMSMALAPQTQVEVYMCHGDARHEMWSEMSRLVSFALLPSVPLTGVWVTRLAEAGFYCPDKNRSLLRCAFCQVEVEMDAFRNRVPSEVHRAQCPSCPLLKGEAPNTAMEQQAQKTSSQYNHDFFGHKGASSPSSAAGRVLHQEVKPLSLDSGKEKQVPRGAAAQSHCLTQPVSSRQSSSLPAPPHGLAPPPPPPSVFHPEGGRQGSGSSPPTSNTSRAQSAASPATMIPLTPAVSQSTGTDTRTAEDEPSPPPTQPEQQRGSQNPRGEALGVEEPSQEGSRTLENVHAQTAQNSNAGSQTPEPASAQTTSNTSAGQRRENNSSSSSSNTTPYQTARVERTEEPGTGSRHSDTASAPATAGSEQSPEAGNESARQVVTYSQLGIYTQEPKRPDFAIVGARVRTYSNWPHCTTHTPEDMAHAGFYYVGLEDLARCFYCKGGLKTWSPSLRPWVEHARFYPNCPFVGQVKGQEFIQVVQELKAGTEEITEARVEEELRRRQQGPSNDGGDGGGAVEGGFYDGDGDKDDDDDGDDDDQAEEGSDMEQAAEELENKNDEIKNERICKICQEADVSILFLPCGHLVSCSHCAPALRTCAVCRQRVKGRVRVLENDHYEQPDTELERQPGLGSK